MATAHEIELVFEPQDEGGYHVYAPELPGLHTEGESLEEATGNAREALALYVEGVREDVAHSIRRKPHVVAHCVSECPPVVSGADLAKPSGTCGKVATRQRCAVTSADVDDLHR